MNKLIVFEGIDGSGKSTQIKLLEDKLSMNGLAFDIFREPGGNILSEKIRKILLDKNLNICDTSETMLFLAARAQLTYENIIPSLNKDNIVICDRFSDSTYVYQGFGKNIDKNIIKESNEFVTNKIKPILTIILDISYEDSLKRRGKINDRMENNSKLFFDNVRAGYRQLAMQNSTDYFLVDGMLDVNNLHKIIWSKINKVINI